MGFTSVNCGGARFRYYQGELDTWNYHGLDGAHSPDGMHWTLYDEPIMPWYSDTQNVAFWDDRLERYVAYVRWNEHLHVDEGGRQVGSFDYRAIARSESVDFANFPAPEKILEPDFSLVEDADQSGGGLYNTAAIKYPLAADAYLIFTSAYHHTSDTLDIQLAISRDGIHFDRWLEPLVRLGVTGRFDSRSLYMKPGFVAAGDQLFFYYTGMSSRHDLDLDHDEPPCAGRLRIRLDGFVSQDADAEESSLTTVPFVLEGDRLQLNMDASSRGWLNVEVLDASGHTLWGYSKAEADRLMFNDIAQAVTWNGDGDLSSLRGPQRAAALHRSIGETLRLPVRPLTNYTVGWAQGAFQFTTRILRPTPLGVDTSETGYTWASPADPSRYHGGAKVPRGVVRRREEVEVLRRGRCDHRGNWKTTSSAGGRRASRRNSFILYSSRVRDSRHRNRGSSRSAWYRPRGAVNRSVGSDLASSTGS